MNLKYLAAALIAVAYPVAGLSGPALADETPTSVEIRTGSTLYGADGKRIAKIYKVSSDGTAQVIVNSKLYRVPVSTISQQDGKLTTTMTRSEIVRGR
ncbi:MAG: hypothetical protein N2423_06895 [Novosphingobium sp.]|nr:hypothetical protein [Novosphingobium sp.]